MDCALCWIEVAAAHAEGVREFVEKRGCDSSTLAGDRMHYEFSEAPCGGYDIFREMAKERFAVNGRQRRRVPFIGGYEADRYGEWEAGVFASDTRQLIDVAAVSGKPTVPVESNGKPQPIDMRAARQYWRTRKRAEAMMQAVNEAWVMENKEKA